MTLHVFTSRISCRDPDRFDVTRKSGGAAGHPFAPSWGNLMPAIEAWRQDADDAVVPARRNADANRATWGLS